MGHGQGLDRFLTDLHDVLKAAHDVSTPDATLLLVAGSIRRKGKLVALPSLMAVEALRAGWTLREQITWFKGKALPWTRYGEFRDVTEEVALFSKGQDYSFNIDQLCSPEPASEWWIRYPERYSPAGRRPTNLWEIPIPTQGSWKQGPRHACPFPPELAYRLLTLVTSPGDAVLDPFAGVGTVPAMASATGRIGYGIELVQRYVDQLELAFEDSVAWLASHGEEFARIESLRRVFRNAILSLRLLKFGKHLATQLRKEGFQVSHVKVARLRRRSRLRFKLVVGDFTVGMNRGHSTDESVVHAIDRMMNRPPLSKFGIEPIVTIAPADLVGGRCWYPGCRFWNSPVRDRPDSPGPHLVSDFRPALARLTA